MKYLNTLLSIMALLILFSCGPSSENNPEANKTIASKPLTKSPTVLPAARPYDFHETTSARASTILLAENYERSPGTGSTLYDAAQFDYLWYVKNAGESAFFYKNTGITFTYAYDSVGSHGVLLEVYVKNTQTQVRSHLIEMTVQ